MSRFSRMLGGQWHAYKGAPLRWRSFCRPCVGTLPALLLLWSISLGAQAQAPQSAKAVNCKPGEIVMQIRGPGEQLRQRGMSYADFVEEVRQQQNLPKLNVRDMQYAVYTPAFAKRFNLPESKDGEALRDGLLAVEFEMDDWRGVYSSKLNVYLDNSLPVAFHQNESLPMGSGALPKVTGYNGLLHFFIRPRPGEPATQRIMELSQADKNYFFNNQNEKFGYVVLTSAGYVPGKPGFRSSVPISVFNRELFPGIAYFQFGMLARAIDVLQHQTDVEIRLPRAGKPGEKWPPEQQLAFPVPRTFFERIKDWDQQAGEINSKIRDEEHRRARGEPFCAPTK